MSLFLQLFVNGLIGGAHYALLAAGFGLIFATTRMVHFAYGPIYTVAAYVAWVTAGPLHWPLYLALAAAAASAAVLGVLSYQLLYRPIEERGGSTLVILIASLGLFIVLENLVGIVFGTGNQAIANFDSGIHVIGPVFFTTVDIWQVVAVLVLMPALGLFLGRSRPGKAILAMTDNAEMARIVGIDTVKVSILVFALGSAISAVPAMLTLLRNGADPSMGFLAVFIAFVAVVVGGIGSLKGAVAGGFALGMVESLGLWKIPTEWQNSIAFIVLFLVVLFRPQGLFGRAAR